MSTGTICLNCRRYLEGVNRCACPNPVPSDDGKTPNRPRARRAIRQCEPPCPVDLCIEWSKAGMCQHEARYADPT